MPKVERPVNSYGFPRAMGPTPQQTPQRRVPTSSHIPTDNRPNRSTDPGAKLAHAADRAHCSDARTTVRQPPNAGTHRGQQGPGRNRHSPPQRTARIKLIYPLTHRPTPSRPGPHSANPITTTTQAHSPHPKASTSAKLTPPGQAAHLQSIRTPYSLAQGGSRGDRRWPGHRHPKTATSRTVPGDTEAQTPPTTCPAHRP